MKIRRIAAMGAPAVMALVMMSGCSEKRWSASGRVANGEGKSLVLEAPNGTGGWYAVDTIEVDGKGMFVVKGEPAGHPEVYRLTLGGESLYFPIDSLESVSIEADTKAFGTAYTVSGSESAEKMQQINELIDKVVKAGGEQAVAYDPELKRSLAELILRDPAGIVAYYTIFRKVGNTQLFDPTQKSDLRLIGAVANAFAQQRPSDPRTAFLKDFYIANRKAGGMQGAPTDTIVAQEILIPEIKLLDDKGDEQLLTEVASRGNVVLLNFTAYGAEESPAFNIELAKVYNENKEKGFEIYQVSVDDDEFFWKQAAGNLPWITVYNSPKAGGENLVRYNVRTLPTTFIINRKGELVERVENVSGIASAVKRYL